MNTKKKYFNSSSLPSIIVRTGTVAKHRLINSDASIKVIQSEEN